MTSNKNFPQMLKRIIKTLIMALTTFYLAACFSEMISNNFRLIDFINFISEIQNYKSSSQIFTKLASIIFAICSLLVAITLTQKDQNSKKHLKFYSEIIFFIALIMIVTFIAPHEGLKYLLGREIYYFFMVIIYFLVLSFYWIISILILYFLLSSEFPKQNEPIIKHIDRVISIKYCAIIILVMIVFMITLKVSSLP